MRNLFRGIFLLVMFVRGPVALAQEVRQPHSVFEYIHNDQTEELPDEYQRLLGEWKEPALNYLSQALHGALKFPVSKREVLDHLVDPKKQCSQIFSQSLEDEKLREDIELFWKPVHEEVIKDLKVAGSERLESAQKKFRDRAKLRVGETARFFLESYPADYLRHGVRFAAYTVISLDGRPDFYEIRTIWDQAESPSGHKIWTDKSPRSDFEKGMGILNLDGAEEASIPLEVFCYLYDLAAQGEDL